MDNHYYPIGINEREEYGDLYTPGLYLKKYLTKEVGELLTGSMKARMELEQAHDSKVHALKKRKTEKPEEAHVTVANIEFAYNNHELIKLLQQRGLAITYLQFEKVKELDEKITALFKDEKKVEMLTRPVCAFITFENDEGTNEAIAYSMKSPWYRRSKKHDFEQMTIFNQVPKFKLATEPTNIIWENRHIKGINYGARVFGALLISAFMLILAFFAIFAFKKAQIVNQQRWPNVDCESLVDVYGQDKIKLYAGLEYMEQVSTNGQQTMMGALKCECHLEIKNHGTLDTFNKQFTFTDIDGKE